MNLPYQIVAWTEPFTNSSAITENARRENKGWEKIKIRYQTTVKEKEKEAYKMEIKGWKKIKNKKLDTNLQWKKKKCW